MTLVAGLSVGGLPAFIGDLLVSWRIPSVVELPTKEMTGVRPGIGKDHAAGLAQKLVVIRPYLLLAWAGRQSTVERIIDELDSLLPSTEEDLHDPDVMLRVLDTCDEGTELIALLAWEKAIHPICVRTRGFELQERRIYLLGTGASEFFEYLQDHPEILPTQEQADGLVARAILLRFAARAMVAQWIIGAGLEESWGGGFEIAFAGPRGFEKVNNVLFRGWMIDEQGAYHPSGRSFFSRYYGGDLHLSWFGSNEKTFVIRSPVGMRSKPPEYEKAYPEWTVDVFLMRKHGSFVEFARYHPPHRAPSDLFEFADGALIGWALDREYVEGCVKKAITVAPQEQAIFDMTRY